MPEAHPLAPPLPTLRSLSRTPPSSLSPSVYRVLPSPSSSPSSTSVSYSSSQLPPACTSGVSFAGNICHVRLFSRRIRSLFFSLVCALFFSLLLSSKLNFFSTTAPLSPFALFPFLPFSLLSLRASVLPKPSIVNLRLATNFDSVRRRQVFMPINDYFLVFATSSKLYCIII